MLLVGRPPDHLDSHQHVHRDEPTRGPVLALGERLGVTVREAAAEITYSGVFYGQDAKGIPVPEAITTEALIAAIERLPFGTTELACHPAASADHDSAYGEERLREAEGRLRPPRPRGNRSVRNRPGDVRGRPLSSTTQTGAQIM